MSETEYHSGVLHPLDMSKGLEETAKEICEKHGWEKDKWHSDYEELLCDEGYMSYVVANGVIYKVDDDDMDPYDDVYVAEKQSDGSYRYTLKYYNGGCGFSEAIETALERAKESSDAQDQSMEEMAVPEEEDES